MLQQNIKMIKGVLQNYVLQWKRFGVKNQEVLDHRDSLCNQLFEVKWKSLSPVRSL